MIEIVLAQICVSVAIAAVLATLKGALSPAASAVSLLGGAVAAIWIYRNLKKVGATSTEKRKIDFFSGAVLIFSVLVMVRQFLYLLYYNDGKWLTLNPNNLGDLSLHLSILRNLSNGGPFWPHFPSMADKALQYPFGIDFYNALWDSLGVPLQSHLLFVGLICGVLLIWSLFEFMGPLGPIAVLFNGGLWGYQFLWTGVAHDYQANWAWKNFFNTLIIPQRGFLVAIPLGIYLLQNFLKDRTRTRFEIAWIGFLWGMLPFFHVHSFIILSLIFGAITLFRRNWSELMRLLAVAVPVSLVWVLPLTGFFRKASMIWLHWGWSLSDQSILSFIVLNFGPWLILFGYAYWQARKNKDVWDEKLLALALGLFLIFQFVMMAPWEWDNIKILIWPYLLAVMISSRVLEKVEVNLRNVALCFLGFSGFVSVVATNNVQNKGNAIYTASVLNAMETPLKQVPPNSVFAAGTIYNHPLTYFGFNRVLGWAGHIWSHGLADEGKGEKLKAIMTGAPDWKSIAKNLQITHIFWSDLERDEFKTKNPEFSQLKNLSNSEEVQIYVLE